MTALPKLDYASMGDGEVCFTGVEIAGFGIDAESQCFPIESRTGGRYGRNGDRAAHERRRIAGHAKRFCGPEVHTGDRDVRNMSLRNPEGKERGHVRYGAGIDAVSESIAPTTVLDVFDRERIRA